MNKSNKKEEVLKFCFSIYAGAIVIQNVLATKQIDIAIFTVTTGILISPVVFIIQDIVSEIFGYEQSKKMIIYGFLINFIGVLLFCLAIKITPSQFWLNQQAFENVLGTTLRITIASFMAYIVGSLVNSYVMVYLKSKCENRLFFRAIISTIFGQGLDNFLFALVAFFGVLPSKAIISMAIGGTIFEVAYELFFFPLTKKIITETKKYTVKG